MRVNLVLVALIFNIAFINGSFYMDAVRLGVVSKARKLYFHVTLSINLFTFPYKV